MRNAAAIAWKESKTYLSTPPAYVIGAGFLSLTGIFFVADVTRPLPQASVRSYIEWVRFFTLFLAPLLTMRLLAEEQKLGTLELLLTAPVRDWEVVIGKYAASLVAFIAAVSPTLYYVLLLYWFADPDTGPLLVAYLGLLLHGAAALAVGLLASSLTSNQIVAAVMGAAALLILSSTGQVAALFDGVGREVLNGMAMNLHFLDLVRGVVDTTAVAYYLSLAAAGVFLTVLSLDTRRWR